jgi:hypothetical protein
LAEVVVTNDAGLSLRAVTDARGDFRLEGVPAGGIHVVVLARGRVPSRLDETVEENTLVEMKVRLEKEADPEAFVATARVEAPPREVTRRSLGATELTKVAGTRGDPIRAVELLPGVTRSAAADGPPILRGANPQDSALYIEGAPAPLLYHLGGLSSVVHARVLESVDVYPSNFSVRYGRKAGGVVEARLRDPKVDRFHGALDLNIIDSSVVVETPVGESFGVLAAVRRSNVDAFLAAAADNSDLSITAAPVYWDYQSVASFTPTAHDRLRLVAYGSSDRFASLSKKPSEEDPAIRGAFDSKDVFHRVQLGYRHRWDRGSELSSDLTYGYGTSRASLGSAIRSDFGVHTLQGRAEATYVLSPSSKVTAGLDLLAERYEGSYRGVPPSTGEGSQARAISQQGEVAVDVSRWVQKPGAYVELGVRPVPTLLLVPGVRADYASLVDRASLDPRFSVRWEATPRTVLKGGVGRYSQIPQEAQSVRPLGNPDLQLTRALHTSVGLEHALSEALTASVEGYAKWLDRVVTGTPDGRDPVFVNTQEARIFGGELMLRVKPRGRFFGFASYSLSRSERRDEGAPWRLFDRDQPHVVSAAGSYRLGRGWELGASFRFTSGAPFTPVVASTYDASTDLYSPRYGRPQSERNPAWSRLDVRVEKKWTFDVWSLAMYLDVQNVLNAPNREGFSYNYDYSARTGARGLPLLPSLGLRGEL